MRSNKVPQCWEVENTPAGAICPCSAHLQQGWDAGVPGGQLRLRSPRGRHSGEPCSAQRTERPRTPGHSPGAPGWQPTTCRGKQGSAGRAGPTSLVMVAAQHPLGAPQWDLSAFLNNPAKGLAHVGGSTELPVLETSSPWWVFGYMYTCVCKSEDNLSCHLFFLFSAQWQRLNLLLVQPVTASVQLGPASPASARPLRLQPGGYPVPIGTGSASAKGTNN